MRSSDAEQRAQARGEAPMGFGMAAMAVPAAVLPPPPWAWVAYAAVFTATALRALRLAHGRGHPGTIMMVAVSGLYETVAYVT
jgi:hypothetical protein